jgi:hypothetical protein
MACEVMLSVQKRGDLCNMTLSSEGVVSRLCMKKNEILRTGFPKTEVIFAAIQASSDLILSPQDCFDRIAKAIHDLYREKAIEHTDYLEHLECMNHYKDGLDVDGFETYLYLSDLVFLAKDFRVYRVSDQTVELWRACWSKVQKLTKSLK